MMPAPQTRPVANGIEAANDRGHPAAVIDRSPAVLTLDADGNIRDCNRASQLLFGYHRNELLSQHIGLVLPQLADTDLMPHGEPNPRLRFLSHIGRLFEAMHSSGEGFSCQLFLNDLGNTQGRLWLIVRKADEDADSREPAAT